MPITFCCHLTDYNASNNISGAAIDLSSLIVVDGKVCWDLYIDGLVVSSDGNLLDALAAAIKVNVDLYWLLLAVSIVIFCNCQWAPGNVLVEKCYQFPHRRLSIIRHGKAENVQSRN